MLIAPDVFEFNVTAMKAVMVVPMFASFNRSIFDVLSYFAAQAEIREAMIAQKKAVQTAYADLVQIPEFQEAVESDTAGMPHTAARFRLWGERLAGALKKQIAVPQVANNDRNEMRFVA